MAFSHCTAVLGTARPVAGTVDSGQVSGLRCTRRALTPHILHQRGMPAPGACISRDKPPAAWTVKARGRPETLCTTVKKGEILPGVVGRALAGRRRRAEGAPGPLPWGSPASRWPHQAPWSRPPARPSGRQFCGKGGSAALAAELVPPRARWAGGSPAS